MSTVSENKLRSELVALGVRVVAIEQVLHTQKDEIPFLTEIRWAAQELIRSDFRKGRERLRKAIASWSASGRL